MPPRPQHARPATLVVRWLLIAVTAAAGLTLWAGEHCQGNISRPAAMAVRPQHAVTATPVVQKASAPRAHAHHRHSHGGKCQHYTSSSVNVVTAAAVHLPGLAASTTPYAPRAPGGHVTTGQRRTLATTTVTLTDIGVSRT